MIQCICKLFAWCQRGQDAVVDCQIRVSIDAPDQDILQTTQPKEHAFRIDTVKQ